MCEVGRPIVHSLSSLRRALGAVIALLLWGQLFAEDTGSEATNNTGQSSGLGGSLTSLLRLIWTLSDLHPLFGKSQYLLLVIISGISGQ